MEHFNNSILTYVILLHIGKVTLHPLSWQPDCQNITIVYMHIFHSSTVHTMVFATCTVYLPLIISLDPYLLKLFSFSLDSFSPFLLQLISNLHISHCVHHCLSLLYILMLWYISGGYCIEIFWLIAIPLWHCDVATHFAFNSAMEHFNSSILTLCYSLAFWHSYSLYSLMTARVSEYYNRIHMFYSSTVY